MLSGVASTGVRETSVLGEDKAGVVGEDIPVPTSGYQRENLLMKYTIKLRNVKSILQTLNC